MSLADKILPHLAMLRRYGRALTGNQASGDAYVKATLEAIVADPNILSPDGDLRVQLYTVFQKIWSSSAVHISNDPDELKTAEVVAGERLSRVTPVNRQALLLKTLEGFSTAQTAAIMGCDDAQVEAHVGDALAELEKQTRSNVLIIEDEAIIAIDLEQIVEGMGHTVTAIAATHDEAVAAVDAQKPGLVLADVQLADGSSGIDAVKEILGRFDVPVIFITAFPERLLTGERPEPTFLLTKPFLSSAVETAISQALFFQDVVPEIN